MKPTSVRSAADAKYDILKFILSLSIVAIHAGVYPQVLYPWLRLSVPLFFIMTSYFLFSKLERASAGQQKEILRGFLLRNLKLYGFWFLVLLPVTLWLRWMRYFSDGVAFGLFRCCRDLLFGSSFFASWYIKASVVGVFLIFYLSKKWKRHLVLAFSLVMFAFVTFRCGYAFIYEGIGIVSTLCRIIDLVLGSPVFSFPAAVIWIFIGKCFAEGKIAFPSPGAAIAGLLLSCVGLYAEWRFLCGVTGVPSWDSFFMLLPACICLFGCVQSIRPVTFRHSLFFRQSSTVTYVLHGSLILIFRKLGILSSPVVLFAVTVLLCIAACIGLRCLLRRSPSGFLKWAC